MTLCRDAIEGYLDADIRKTTEKTHGKWVDQYREQLKKARNALARILNIGRSSSAPSDPDPSKD